MAAGQYFIAKDYLRAFELKNLFHKYVVYYSQLNYHTGEEPLSNKDRHELTLKIQEVLNEITLLVLKMKESKSDPEVLKSTFSQLSTIANKVTNYSNAN